MTRIMSPVAMTVKDCRFAVIEDDPDQAPDHGTRGTQICLSGVIAER